MVSLDAIVLRLSLERFAGELVDLDCYMGIGLAEFPDEELKRIPGYHLQITRYLREGPHLVAVEQVRKHFDVAENRIVNDQEFTLS
jgi:hypothetical protein